jgi:hypothetical protein
MCLHTQSILSPVTDVLRRFNRAGSGSGAAMPKLTRLRRDNILFWDGDVVERRSPSVRMWGSEDLRS